MGNQPSGFDQDVMNAICQDIKEAKSMGIEICIVVGGGNICRGAALSKLGIERASADYMGMLATVMNALAMQSKLESVGLITRVQSAISMVTVCEPYIRRKAIRHMEKGRVVIFAAGLGKPYVTTDTGAALNAIEMRCDVLMKATQVDGIYTSDPKKDKAAVKFDRIDYKTALTDDKINIMDSAAISLASENGMPIIVFDIHKKGELKRVLQGKGAFTIVE